MENLPLIFDDAVAELIRETEAYLAFWAEASPPLPQIAPAPMSFNYLGPRCRRCGAATEWPVERCSSCTGLA